MEEINQKDGLVCNKYVLKKGIGQGSFGKVFLVEDEKGKPYAFKLVENSSYGLESLNELNILIGLEHPNLLSGKDVYNQKNCDIGDRLGIVVELATMSLETYIDKDKQPYRHKPNYKDNILKAINYIMLGVVALHDFNIIHLDIKPDNVLVFLDQDGNIINACISDMGSCVYVDNMNEQASLDYTVGTPIFKPYERIVDNICSSLTDVYSLGLSILSCFDGQILENMIIKDEGGKKVMNTEIMKLLFDNRDKTKSAVTSCIFPYFDIKSSEQREQMKFYADLITDCLLNEPNRITLAQCLERLRIGKILANIKSYYMGDKVYMKDKIRKMSKLYIKMFKDITFNEHLTLTIDLMYIHLTNFELETIPSTLTMINTYSLIAFKVLNRSIVKGRRVDNTDKIFYKADKFMNNIKNFELTVVRDLKGILNGDRPFYFRKSLKLSIDELLDKMRDFDTYIEFFNTVLRNKSMND